MSEQRWNVAVIPCGGDRTRIESFAHWHCGIEGVTQEVVVPESQLTASQSRVEELERERNAAISMLAEWCIRVDINGTGWDDWDESYKDAMHRPCAIRELLDAAIAKERLKWKEEYGRE